MVPRLFLFVLLVLGLGFPAIAQSGDPQQAPHQSTPNQSDDDQAGDQSGADSRHQDSSQSDSKDRDSPTQETQSQDSANHDSDAPGANQPLPRSSGAERTNDESSSRDTIIDLSPPADDAKTHPNSGTEDTDTGDVQEFHPFDPHRAMKDIEVGDFYFKRKNYRAAIGRYREALEYKPNDAIATYDLALALEKVNALDEARTNYEAYLKILPHGPSSEEARAALQRLDPKNTAAVKK